MLFIQNEMGVKAGNDLLQSWKDIAAYLDKDVRTCYRWAAQLGLPVHRMNESSPRSKVFAYRSELDEWLRDRPTRAGLGTPAARSRAPRLAAGWAGGLLVAAAAGFLFIGRPAAPVDGDPFPSIAVAPFENLNPEAPDEYFSEGMTREIVNRLSAAGRVSLIPARLLPEVEKSLGNTKIIRSPIGADYLLKGAVLKGERTVRGSCEILRFSDAGRVLSLQFEEDIDNVNVIAENLLLRMCEALDLPKTTIPASPAADVAGGRFTALDYVMKGRYLLDRLGGDSRQDPWILCHQGRYFSGLASREMNELAVSLFLQALEIDDRFAPALIGLAACYANYVNFGWDVQPKWLDAAEAHLRRAQELSPGKPDYYAILVEVLLLKTVSFGEPRREEAYALAEAGIARHPRHREMNAIAGYCHYMRFGETGREEDFARALEYKAKAFWMDMFSIGNLVYSELLMLRGDLDTAAQVCDMLKASDSGRFSLLRQAEIFYYGGDLGRCEALVNELQYPIEDRAEALVFEAMAAASRGNAARAADRLEKRALLAPPASPGIFSMQDLRLASIHFALKQRAPGLERLRAFFSQDKARRYRHIYVKYVGLDGSFDAVRDDKDFQNILQGVDLWPKAEPSA